MYSYHITFSIMLAGVEVILLNGLKEIVKGTMLLSTDDYWANFSISSLLRKFLLGN